MTSIVQAGSRKLGVFDRARHPDAFLTLAVFVLLPNLLFILVSPWLILRRAISPAVYLLAGIAAIMLPRHFTCPLFVIAGAVDAFLVVSMAFGLPFETAFAAMVFMSEIDPASSLIYVGGAVYFGIIVVLSTLATMRFRDRLGRASLLPAVLAAIAVMLLDGAVNRYKPGVPDTFESALLNANLTSQSIAGKNRNFLLVLVEGMGAFADPAERALLEQRLRDAAQGRFLLKHGRVPYYGSTTGAISRELCGRWGTYLDYMDDKPHDCLPARLARSGYETISFDAFAGTLYALRDWYPRIGIQKMNFREEMERDHPRTVDRLCGTTMQGLCDDDVGALIHKELQAPSERRKFVYWLTLNSHIPYTPVKSGPLRCAGENAAIDSQMTCELTEIWMAVFDRVAEIAADPTVPPLDIVVVGDHNTPMWSRSAASHFMPDLVDWYHLEYVEPTAQTASNDDHSDFNRARQE